MGADLANTDRIILLTRLANSDWIIIICMHTSRTSLFAYEIWWCLSSRHDLVKPHTSVSSCLRDLVRWTAMLCWNCEKRILSHAIYLKSTTFYTLLKCINTLAAYVLRWFIMPHCIQSIKFVNCSLCGDFDYCDSWDAIPLLEPENFYSVLHISNFSSENIAEVYSNLLDVYGCLYRTKIKLRSTYRIYEFDGIYDEDILNITSKLRNHD